METSVAVVLLVVLVSVLDVHGADDSPSLEDGYLKKVSEPDGELMAGLSPELKNDALSDFDKRSGTLFRFGKRSSDSDYKRGGSLFRFGKRGGSLFRFGKREDTDDKRSGSLFRFGKRGGSLFRFGKRSGTLFRFGKREDEMKRGGSLFRFGKRNESPLNYENLANDIMASDRGLESDKRTFFRYGRGYDADDSQVLEDLYKRQNLFRYGRSVKRPHTPFRFGREIEIEQ